MDTLPTCAAASAAPACWAAADAPPAAGAIRLSATAGWMGPIAGDVWYLMGSPPSESIEDPKSEYWEDPTPPWGPESGLGPLRGRPLEPSVGERPTGREPWRVVHLDPRKHTWAQGRT